MIYRARLFRGWETVDLEYRLEGATVVMRRKGTWGRLQEQRVELAALTGEVRRVWGRQPAYLVSMILVVLALLVLGIDAMFHGAGAGGRGVYWPLWGPLLGVVLVGLFVRSRTKRAAEWSHFVGVGKGSGLFVLKDWRDAKGHEKFVEAVKRGAGK